MAKKSTNSSLKSAKKDKNDEFYTQLSDIEKELRHYKEHFKGKVVFCNCDDPRVSNFFHYFSYNFESLGLKKLITTCYKNQDRDLFSVNNSEKAIYLEYTGDKNGDKVPNPEEIGIHELEGDGDFRSAESIELLKEADIVVTNPPFSLFREYVEQLMEYNKKFIIVGSLNAITYKEIFKLIKDNLVWMGYGFSTGNAYFKTPHTKEFASGVYNEETGLVKFRNVSWFTNLEILKRHEDLVLYKSYQNKPNEYPNYINYDAININKLTEIPLDYTGKMGVPITFIDKYNPEQFEIIALGIVGSIDFSSNKKMELLDKNGLSTGKFTMNAKGTLYRKYNPKTDKSPNFKDVETGELYSSIYARVIIKNKRLQ